ncbi:MAG: hypothetical protein Ct9H300mP12_11470 [Acidimicrobiales bacterium]|nr:MAG: hypothetical protein Ct9H300mP12_11470 [Acidimicrobiales bacterium]
MQLPWQPNVAAMQCDPTVEGAAWPYAPRVILKQMLSQAAQQDLVLKAGVEFEYSLLAREADGSLRPADERDTSALPCYDARGLTTALDHLTTVSRHMDAMGWGNYANDHEDANGQFEQNFQYADALTTSDRLIVLRLMLHTLARRQDLYATFMPKPFAERPATVCTPTSACGLPAPTNRCFTTTRPAGPRPQRTGLPVHRWDSGPRPGPERGRLPDGQFVQAHRRRPA